MRIFRISNILFLSIATCFGVMLFWTSQAVQEKENELSVLKTNLTREEETVRVLSVEWDYLNRPQRLEKLAIEQLGMELPSVKEMVRNVNDIPEPPPELFDEGAGMVQAVSMEPAAAPSNAPAPVAVKKETPVSPSTAEKQTFYQLIRSLDGEQ